jgi:hypothetical protein
MHSRYSDADNGNLSHCGKRAEEDAGRKDCLRRLI